MCYGVSLSTSVHFVSKATAASLVKIIVGNTTVIGSVPGVSVQTCSMASTKVKRCGWLSGKTISYIALSLIFCPKKQGREAHLRLHSQECSLLEFNIPGI